MPDQQSPGNEGGQEETRDEAPAVPGLSLSQIGGRLAGRRQQLGLSLAAVQEATKIRSKYLQAIEAGDEAAIPGAVYTRGFIRSYADRVGLDGNELMRQYRLHIEHQQGAPDPNLARVDVAPPVSPARGSQLPKREPKARDGRGWLRWAGVLVVILILIYGAGQWIIAGEGPGLNGPGDGATVNGELDPANGTDSGDDDPPADPNGEDDAENGAAAEPENGLADDEPTEPEPPEIQRVADDASVTYHVAGEGRFDVRLRAQGGNVWLGNLVLDGAAGEPAQMTLQNGDEVVFSVERELRVRVGNPPSLYAEIAGVDMGQVDNEGPRNVVVVRSGE